MNRLIQLIAKLSAEMGQVEERTKEQFNFSELTITQMHYLESINHLINPTITELAAEMNLTKPTVTNVVDKLIEKEFLKRIKSDEDRRITHLHLTEKGKQINRMHDQAHRTLAKTIKKKLTVTELNIWIELLVKVVGKDQPV